MDLTLREKEGNTMILQDDRRPFPDGELSHVESWVRARTDAMRVRIVLPSYRPPRRAGHCHIYKYEGQGK